MSRSNEALIAIDGPSASGKSTVSRMVAQELKFTYVDSGSLYRGITWKALMAGVSTHDGSAVLAMLDGIRVDFHVHHHAVQFTIDGDDPGPALRSESVVERVSDIAAIPEVRAYVVRILQGMASLGQVVMEGRDIGTVVFTHTPFKYYLDADPDERARRRHRELEDRPGSGDFHRVIESLRRRDAKDATRKIAPLQIAENARVINTTKMSIDEVVRLIVGEVKAAGAGEQGIERRE